MPAIPEPSDNMMKEEVRAFWDRESCGEVYAVGATPIAQMREQARERYALEPFILSFARFGDGAGRQVLEIGVGMGADHLEWAKSRPARLAGVDLTPRAVDWTRSRIEAEHYWSDLEVADAESLPFLNESFDIVYSWGVIHHSPDTRAAVAEIHRVLKPNGIARIMIYHTYSIVGLLLWLRYGLLAGKPHKTFAGVYAEQLESPGTQAYSLGEARELFADFSSVSVRLELSPGDLLAGAAGQRHDGWPLRVMRRVWPRWLIRRLFRRFGLFLLIEAVR